MDFDKAHWTLDEARTLHRKVKKTIMDIATLNRYTTEAQSLETAFNMPIPELCMAVETLLTELQSQEQGVDVDLTFTRPFLF